jgi:hypothetical protein
MSPHKKRKIFCIWKKDRLDATAWIIRGETEGGDNLGTVKVIKRQIA